jgi:sulfate permease, SulP family
VGVVFSLLLLLRALAFPPDALLGRTPDGGWHDRTHRADAEVQPGLIVYRFSAPLFFANCNVFRERIEALVEKTAGVRAVVIDGRAIHDVELTAIDMLVDLERELGERGVRLLFGNLQTRVERDIERGLPPLPEGERITFPTVAAAALEGMRPPRS